jgi:hypothetical protein
MGVFLPEILDFQVEKECFDRIRGASCIFAEHKALNCFDSVGLNQPLWIREQ